MKINVIKLIDDLGGSTVLWKTLTDENNVVSLRTVESWKARQKLSMKGLLMIEEIIKTQKLKIKLENYYVINTRKPSDGNSAQTAI